MKILISIIIVIIGNYSFSQCIYCNSLSEALKDPQKTVSLDLSAQGLIEIPKEINKFVNLEELNLCDNQLLEIDFKKIYLPNLKQLNLANNPGFNGAAIDGISTSIPKLTSLNLTGNAIQVIGDELSGLVYLKELYLSKNNLKYFSSSLDAMSSLTVLDVSNNKMVNQPMLFSQLWNLEDLNISGNEDLNWNNLTGSLLFKGNLTNITTTVNDFHSSIPKNFKNIDVSKLTFVDSHFDQLSSAIAQNDSIHSLVFVDCEIVNPEKFYAWIDRFENLNSVEFKLMSIPKGIKDLENVREIIFDDCDFEDVMELAQIKPQIDVLSKNCNISNGDFEGNAKKFRTITIPMAQYEMNNSLPVIKEIEAKEIVVSGADSLKIDLGFSSYEIPKSAFLDKNGVIYQGPVLIKIKELNDPIKNALAGVPMVFNNGADQLFGSSGMIDFRATDEKGNELFPNPDNQIIVELNDVQPSKSNDLYVFNEQSKNWELIGIPKSTDMDSLRKTIMDSLAKISDADIVGVRTIPIIITFKYKKRRYNPTELVFDYSDINLFQRKQNRSNRNYYTHNVDQQAICRTTWKLDTLHSLALDSLLKKSKYEQRSTIKLLKNMGRSNYANLPRFITALRITPNIERDDYTMAFNYRDREYKLPVYKEMSGSIETVQRKEKKDYANYVKKKVKAGKDVAKIKKEQDKYIKEQADMIRMSTLEYLIRNRSAMQENVDKLRFGLSSFGLVNCDYFSRNVPVATIKLDSVAVDQNGNLIYVPYDIRNIVIDDNTFVSTNDRSFPIFERLRSIPIFALGALEICVIKTWKKLSNGLFRAEVFRFSSENLSSDEVRGKIVDN